MSLIDHDSFIGRRIRLSGGFEIDPQWQCGKDAHEGRILKAIPGQNGGVALVAELDCPITVDDITGTICILELRYAESSWNKVRNIVHIELCDFDPEPKKWQDRRQGKWVESHATFELLAQVG